MKMFNGLDRHALSSFKTLFYGARGKLHQDQHQRIAAFAV